MKIGFGKAAAGFTLAEVAISVAIAGLTFAGVIYGYAMTSDHAYWSAYSLAAQSAAAQAVEQVRAAQWSPQAWPPVDQLAPTNFTQSIQLDLPGANGTVILATNYVSVSTFSASPPLRQICADCVWMFPGRKNGSKGPFTNTVASLRAADQ